MRIDKRIYLDQFMLENRRMGSMRERSTKTSLEDAKSGTNSYRNYGKENADLCKALKTSLEFLKSKDNDEMTLVDLVEEEETKIVYDPKDLEVSGNIRAAVEVIEDALEKVTGEVNKIEGNLKDSEKSGDAKKYAYDLQAILMHSEEADNERYYAFIFDGEKWRRYDDEEVVEESEENVFYETTQGHNTSPSALIYLSSSHPPAAKDSALSASKLISGPQHSVDCYNSPLPRAVKREVLEDNLRLDREVSDRSACLVCSKALELYQKRHEKLMRCKKQANYAEWNFVADLEFKRSPYYRYVLLDSIVKELTDGIISLNSIEENDKLHRLLSEVFMKQCTCAPSSLKLSAEEMVQLEASKKAFINNMVSKAVQQHMLIKLMSKDWEQGLDTIGIYLTNKLYSDKFSKKLIEDLLKMLSLRFVSLVSASVMNKSFAKILVPLKYITRKIAKWVDLKDTHMRHCKQYLEFILKECAALIPKKVVDEFNKELKLLDSDSPVEFETVPINAVP
eukprot:TRINITY_DN657_c0_g3_i9.p1 TRINITY_DN657_c0_g3~~TRINITY_DN657_c0_g3_i9.p1  ORF type:complete len:508 (+),score=183.74 TRINITY_DN657_c0_g3_i9:1155-2678(+)